MKPRHWKNLIDVDMPQLGPITEQTRRQAIQYNHRFRGSVRIALGKFWTDEEYEKYREEQLKPLP